MTTAIPRSRGKWPAGIVLPWSRRGKKKTAVVLVEVQEWDGMGWGEVQMGMEMSWMCMFVDAMHLDPATRKILTHHHDNQCTTSSHSLPLSLSLSLSIDLLTSNISLILTPQLHQSTHTHPISIVQLLLLHLVLGNRLSMPYQRMCRCGAGVQPSAPMSNRPPHPKVIFPESGLVCPTGQASPFWDCDSLPRAMLLLTVFEALEMHRLRHRAVLVLSIAPGVNLALNFNF
jgi:hypothetical protein